MCKTLANRFKFVKRDKVFPATVLCVHYWCFVFVLSSMSLACGPGTYKDTVGNDISCLKCPGKSNSTLPGAAVCTCDNGYYRATGESAAFPCTGKRAKQCVCVCVCVCVHKCTCMYMYVWVQYSVTSRLFPLYTKIAYK